MPESHESEAQSRARQRQALEWFERSLEQPEAERDAWLDANCKDSALRECVRRLQRADAIDEAFLDDPHAFVAISGAGAGDRVGAYCIDRLLAEGGMGSVFLAHRDDGVYQQHVAIKFLHPLLRNPEAYRRFAAERQILAQLQHPNIAQMLDAGSSDEGVPYVVMEYVNGVPITEYCRQHKLSLEARLDLFRQVCSAVATAHRALVVHRDLKPENILVTADGRPMLLDFGIAKILEGEAGSGQEDPATTMVALTPAYASPEQIQRDVITTSSDIYSLGVLLYELLCGQRPYELGRLTPAQAEQLVCDTVPPLPSQLFARRNPARHAARALQGDLDVITMKALRKEPHRRYGSVQELSEDVHRYLRRLPIQARADSLTYRLRKFVGRNRWGVIAAGVIVLSLIGGIVTTSWQASRARQQAARAEALQVRAEHINEFFKKILMSPSSQWISSIRKGPDVTMAEVLGIAAERADKELAEQPDIHADVLTSITQAFVGMGLYDQAAGTGHRALALVREHLPRTNRLQVDARYQLARALDLKGDYPAGKRLYQQALEFGQRLLPPQSPTLALIHNDLAMLYASQNHLSQAEQELQVALALHRQRLQGQPDPAMAIALNNLGVIRTLRGDLDGAMSAYHAALTEFARMGHREYAENANLLSNISVVHVIREQWPQARAAAHKAVGMGRRLLGEDNPNYAVFLIHQANADIGARRSVEAGAALDEARRILAKRIAPAHIYQVWLETSYGAWFLMRQKTKQAIQSLQAARDSYLQGRAPATEAHPSHSYALVLGLLGEAYLADGKPEQAQALLKQSVGLETALYGRDVAEVKRFRELLARSKAVIGPCPASGSSVAAPSTVACSVMTAPLK
ncbi:MAG: serine/threonine-protein kinase [Rhodanobacteraceae bacterium]